MHTVIERKNVAPARIWSVEDILDEKALPLFFAEIEEACRDIISYKNTLTPQNILDCLTYRSKVSHKIEQAYVYIYLKADEDKSNAHYQELSEKIDYLSVRFSSACSFIEPSVASFPVSVLQSLRDRTDEKARAFSMYFDGVLRSKKHLLSAKEEALLSASYGFSGDFSNIFSMFDNVDVDFGEIVIHGEKVPLSHGVISVCLQNSDENVRRDAYEHMYAAYKKHINTIAATYAGNVKKDWFYTQARKFHSCLSRALYAENIPQKVYDNLLSVVNDYNKYMHEYVAYRKKTLKTSVLHMYDMYVPLVKDIETEMGYDEAFDLVTRALAPLGKDYTDMLLRAEEEKWLDVEETPNKRSGAYSWAVYGTHPFVLLNHKGTMHDIFTIAHEMGHAMHSYYSNKTQCYEQSEYCIFIAEIASTVNEVLLIKYLLKEAEGDERKYLLSYYLDMIRTTLFRQTMFAEFEKFSHEIVERGDALGSEKMCAYYAELNRKYYGASVETDTNISYEWARIPHFYRSFYVYKYATGITCAINIANSILENEDFVQNYKEFLSLGGSKYPMEILKTVGIDLTKKSPFIVAMKEFRTVLAELKRMK